jgi:hypothetical protein
VIRTLRLMTCVAVLLLAGGTAWAQPIAVPPPVPQIAPPFLPPPPGFIPCAAPGPNGCCVCMPAPNQPTNDMTISDTVYDLMGLYRMVYRQGNYKAAADIARRVEMLNPILGQAALSLVSASTECNVQWGCCVLRGPNPCCSAAASCCKANQTAKNCACGTDCTCCKGDTSNCACGKSCKCQPAKPSAAGVNRLIISFLPLPCAPGMPCSMLPVPFVFNSAPACAPANACPANAACPFMGLVGPAPVAVRCCPATACSTCPPCCQPCQASPAQRIEKTTPVCITASGSRVHISTPSAEVECDRVTSMERGGRVQLEGNVCVRFLRDGGSAAVSAEHISLGLRDGSYQINGLSDVSYKVNKPVCGDNVYRIELESPNGCR